MAHHSSAALPLGVIGAIVARRTKDDPVALAAVGGLTSFVSAHLTYRLRRALMEHLPAFAAAVVEDAVVIATATAGASLMRDCAIADREHS